MKAITKAAIACVTSGSFSNEAIGTAFLIAHGYALTALHVVGDRSRILRGERAFYEPIKLVFEGTAETISADVPEFWNVEEDWALLKLSSKTPKGVVPIPLASLQDGDTPIFEAFGYPIEHKRLTIRGKVRDPNATYDGVNAI